MANILKNTKVGKVNRSQGQHMRAMPVKADLSKSFTEDGLDLRDMPQGHLVCNNCGDHRFNAMFQGAKLLVQCANCSWVGILKIKAHPDVDLYNATRLCDLCPSDEFSIVRVGGYVSLGCAKCFTDAETFDLKEFNKLF